YVVPTGRVVVPTGRVVVLTGRVVVPTGRVISPGRILTGRHPSSGFSTLVFQHRAITPVVPLIPTFLVSDSPFVVTINGMLTILCQMTDFFAVGALGCTLSIMVIVAFRAQRFRSSIWFLLLSSYIIRLNHILFLEELLLSLVVVVEFSLVLSLSFRINAEFLIHQIIGQFDSIIKSLGSYGHNISMNVIGKSTDVLIDLLGLVRNEFSAHQGQFLETLSVTSNVISFDLQVLWLVQYLAEYSPLEVQGLSFHEISVGTDTYRLHRPSGTSTRILACIFLVKVVATAKRLEMPLSEVCTAIEEKR
nr:hypothetical protein [Tanacetum cinerariifolium]